MVDVATSAKRLNGAEQPTVLRSDFDLVVEDRQRAIQLLEDVYNLVAANKCAEAKMMMQQRVNNITVRGIPPFILGTVSVESANSTEYKS